MLSKISLITAAIAVTMTGVGYWYYNNTQQKIDMLTRLNANLETKVSISEKANETLREDYTRLNTELRRVYEDFSSIQQQNSILENKLAEHDLGFLASQKPVLIENIINNATKNVNRCFEILSGDSLTESERNATDGKSFNSECPWLYDDAIISGRLQ